MEDKITLLEKLIKESKITLNEALILLDKKETPITPVSPFKVSPYTIPNTQPTKNPYWYEMDPFHVTCRTTSCYPEGTSVTFTN